MLAQTEVADNNMMLLFNEAAVTNKTTGRAEAKQANSQRRQANRAALEQQQWHAMKRNKRNRMIDDEAEEDGQN